MHSIFLSLLIVNIICFNNKYYVAISMNILEYSNKMYGLKVENKMKIGLFLINFFFYFLSRIFGKKVNIHFSIQFEY